MSHDKMNGPNYNEWHIVYEYNRGQDLCIFMQAYANRDQTV